MDSTASGSGSAATTTTYTKRDLYGGAMAVELPSELIDGSTLRQIPDHQELFLSPTSLLSLITELNTALPQPDALLAAATHFHDPVAPPDISALTDTTPLALQTLHLPGVLARGTITGADGAVTVALMLLVRLTEKDTDICVRVNVPGKEFGADTAGLATEVAFAGRVLERVAATLEVRDWGLFV